MPDRNVLSHMVELTFTPTVTVTIVDDEVQSAVIDWVDSYDEAASGIDEVAASPLTEVFDRWLLLNGAGIDRHELFPEE